MPSAAHQANPHSLQVIPKPSHRIARRVKLMRLGLGPAAAAMGAVEVPAPTMKVVAGTAGAAALAAWAATDEPFAFRYRVDLAERRAAQGLEGRRPSPTAPEEAHTSHSGSGGRDERAFAASRENALSSRFHRDSGGDTERM